MDRLHNCKAAYPYSSLDGKPPWGGDPANYPQARVEFDYDAVEEERVGVEPSVSAALLKFIAFLIDSNNYLLKLDIAIAAIGCPLYQGSSYTELAIKHTISKQAFDKHVLKFQKDFQLPITRSQKSLQARQSYKKTQLDRKASLDELRKSRQQQLNPNQWKESLKKVIGETTTTNERKEQWQNSLGKVKAVSAG
jgi:hypothetical protein